MGRLRVAPIVEGRRRVRKRPNPLASGSGTNCSAANTSRCIKPIRQPQGTVLQTRTGFDRRSSSRRETRASPPISDDPSLVLILRRFRRRTARPSSARSSWKSRRRASISRIDVACVLAHVMYETWFVAAAESLSELSRPRVGRTAVPRARRVSEFGKSWIERACSKSRSTSRRRHQPAMTSAMDLAACRTARLRSTSSAESWNCDWSRLGRASESSQFVREREGESVVGSIRIDALGRQRSGSLCLGSDQFRAIGMIC